MRGLPRRAALAGLGMLLGLCLAVPADARVATGTYIGDGEFFRTISGVGFLPDLVLVKSDGGYPAVITMSTMESYQGKELSENQALSFGDFGGLEEDRFYVRSSDHVNKDGTRYDWLALQAEAGLLVVGVYTGNGADNRGIELGFKPDHVMVVPAHDRASVHHTSAMTNDFALPFDNSASVSNRIQNVLGSGFQVGDDNAINEPGVDYHYLAWREEPGRYAVGTYLGDDTDDRDIGDPAFRPAWVMTKGDSGEEGIHLMSSLQSRGESLYFVNRDNDVDRIQDLLADGFQVGSDMDVNEAGKDFYWSALAISHDLDLSHAADRDTALVGDQVVYTVTLSNPGPDRMGSAQVGDLLPLELQYVGHTVNNGTYEPDSGSWKLTQIEPGSAAVLEIMAEVRPGSAGGVIVCDATITSHSDNDPDPSNNAASATVVVPRTADLRLSGYVDDPQPEVGQTVLLGVGAQNLGPDAATGVLVTGALPAGLTYVSHSVNVGTYDPISGTWSINTLGAMTFALLQINVRVEESAAGQTLAYTPSIASIESDPNPDDNTTTIEVSVLAADLVLEKTVDEPSPPAGGQVVFRVTLRNDGPDAAGSIAVRDMLPDGLTYVWDAPSQGLYDPDNGLWDVGSMLPGGTATLDLTADVDDTVTGIITNTATILTSDPTDPDTDNNTASAEIDVLGAEIHLEGAVNDDRPDVGETVTFSITAENTSGVAATDVIVRDLLPAGLTYVDDVPSTGTYNPVNGRWLIGELAGGASCVLQLSASVDPGTGGTTIVNVASVFSFAQIDQEIRSTLVQMPVTVRAADLHLVKNVDDPTPVQGAEVVFSILATNEGPDTAYNVVLADTLPAGLVYVSDTPDRGSYNTATGLWDIGDLPAGDTATLDITALVQLDVGSGDSATNTARIVASDQEDPDPGDNSDSAVLTQQSADLALEKWVDDTAPAAGDTVLYTLVLDNGGPSLAGGVAALDILPAGAEYASHDPPGANYNPVTGLWTIGTLAAGDADTLRISALIVPEASGETLDNEVSVAASDQADPDGSNNQAQAVLTVRAADLGVAMTVDDPAPTVGDTVQVEVGLANAGPDASDAATLQIDASTGLALLDWDATGGVFDADLGLWSLTGLPAAAAETLTLTLRVLPGTIGHTKTVSATVVTASPGDPDSADDADEVKPGNGGQDLSAFAEVMTVDQSDRDKSNNAATAALHILGAGLRLSSFVDLSSPDEGDDVNFTLSVANLGPDAATGVTVADTIPVGLAYVSHTPPTETFTQSLEGVWTWNVDQVESQTPRVLFVRTRVLENTTGQVLRHTAHVFAGPEEDPQPDDNLAVNVIVVEGVDLGVDLTVDDANPAEGDTLTYVLSVANLGPHDATGVAVLDSLGTGLTLLAAEPPAGFDLETRLWSVGDLAADEARQLELTVRVDERTGGSLLLHHACVDAVDQVDPVPGNDAVDLEVAVSVPGEGHVLAAAATLPDTPLRPLGTAVDLLAVDLVNWSVVPDTLDSMTLHNAVDGDGSQAELDASWASLFLWRLDTGGRTLLAQADAPFTGGAATLGDLRLTLAPGDTLRLVAGGVAAATARDGDSFGLSLSEADDLVYTRQVIMDAAWPLATASTHLVDAFVAAQATVEPVDAGVLAPGGTHHLALSVVLPADGYAPHALNELAVVNLGTARPVEEISAVRAWLDDGDGAFSTIFDEALGELVWTGDRWVLAGLSHTIPIGGARVMVSVDAAPMAEGLRSVQLAIPVGGVETDEDADGPLDAPLINPFAQVVSGSDRLWLSAATIPWRSVHPDGGETLLLHLTATNTFDEPRTLTGLRVTGTVTSPYTDDPAVLDGVVSQFLLRDDADLDGTYTPADEGGVLGATSLVDGTADFGGLDWTVPPSATRHIFVTARLSTDAAADGDNVAASVASAVDVQFDGSAELAGNWPLGSGGLLVDGLLASAVTPTPVPARSIAPGEGPVLALDLRVPRNGHADDVLGRIAVANLGTATTADVAELRLFRDGGAGIFAGGGADDVDLGLLDPQDGLWTADGLGEPVGAVGARLYVGASGAVGLTDSTTIRLSVPVDGLQYASANDGPLDAALDPGGTLLLSRAPLQVALTAVPGEVIAGQSVSVSMTVRNTGIEAALDVAPSALAPAGDGGLVLADGPLPAVLDLAPGEVDTFAWTYTADAVGTVTLTGSASGHASGGAPLSSLPITTGPVTVVAPPPSLVLAPLSQLPFAVNGGQTDVSALTLDLEHPGDAGSAAVRIDGLTIGLEDGQGQPVPAGGLLSVVKMRADGELMQAYTVALDEGPVLQLVPAADLVLTPGARRVITLDVDIAAGAAGAEFRLVLAESDLAATDVVAGGTVEVTLDGGTWPVMSELARVVDGASALDLTLGPVGDSEASQGQSGVRLGSLTVANNGVPELDAGIQLGVAAVSLYEAAGPLVTDPAAVLEHVNVWLDGESLAWLDVGPGMTQPFALILSRLVAVEAGQSADLEIRGGLRPNAPVGAYRLAVDDVAGWDARDANSGEPVSVNANPMPLLAEPLAVVTPAALVHLGGRPSGLPELTEGALDQPVLEIDLRHPDEAGTAPVAVDTLRLRCVDGLGVGLATDTFLTRVSIRAGGEVVGAVLPTDDPAGYLAVSVAGVSVAPASMLTLEVAVDLLDGAGVESFAFLHGTEDVSAVDAHLHTPVEVTADAGVVVPLSTGARVIRVAADELIVGVEDLMPVVISVLGGETPVMRLELENPAPVVAGNLVVDGLVVRTRGDAKSAVSLGDLAHELLAYHGDDLWGTSGTLARGDSTAVISPPTPLELGPGVVDELEIRVVLVAEPAAATLTLGLNLDDISARQPEGDLVDVSVLPASGQVFPFWTAPGTVSAASLEESYSNFPNPFAAGREATTFVFALDAAATVDLRLYTPRGELVRTLLDGADLPAGLYQDVDWSGRNGRGETVRNGVYVAELKVRFEDGTSARLRRKVAVVR